jgi:hypothetical protein
VEYGNLGRKKRNAKSVYEVCFFVVFILLLSVSVFASALAQACISVHSQVAWYAFLRLFKSMSGCPGTHKRMLNTYTHVNANLHNAGRRVCTGSSKGPKEAG